MYASAPARPPAGRSRTVVVTAILAAVAALAVLAVQRSPLGGDQKHDVAHVVPTTTVASRPAPAPVAPTGSVGPDAPDRLPRDQQGALTEADGVVPDGVTVFDDQYPALAKLDPALLRALRQAATVAARAQVTFIVDSGWRSAKYQEQLLRQAIAKYGSEAEAARWVASPEKSAHVSGDAVDIGPAAAAAWLSKHGATYGLCQIYANEAWHYELRPDAVEHGCPRMYADPTQDPRMQP